jgi:hypothetical protein
MVTNSLQLPFDDEPDLEAVSAVVAELRTVLIAGPG